MPDVRKCPHCYHEITPGDVQRMARAEIESGLRKEFDAIHLEEVERANRTVKNRMKIFWCVILAAMSLATLLMGYFFQPYQGPNTNSIKFFVFLVTMVSIIYVGIFWWAPRFIDLLHIELYNELEDKFKEFKAARGYSSGT